MGKIILEFDSVSEFSEANLAINAGKLNCAISEFDQKLRSLEKYEDKENISIEDCRKILREMLDDNDIDADTL